MTSSKYTDIVASALVLLEQKINNNNQQLALLQDQLTKSNHLKTSFAAQKASLLELRTKFIELDSTNTETTTNND